MASYSVEYRRRPGGRRAAGGRRARGVGYGGEYRYGAGYLGRRARLPGKPARGFPVRGIHTYDLDYGRQAGGPTTDYSGRAGYAEDRGWTETPRGPYTPRLAEIGRAARRRRLYGRYRRPYSPPWREEWERR